MREAQNLLVLPHPKKGPTAAIHRVQATAEFWMSAAGVRSDAIK
jgi:hypothetical protein